ncbi:MAG: hypothetical protein QNK36_15125 [Colwellia sp.]|nr:hypothetical protein [Colwellia sp.]
MSNFKEFEGESFNVNPMINMNNVRYAYLIEHHSSKWFIRIEYVGGGADDSIVYETEEAAAFELLNLTSPAR